MIADSDKYVGYVCLFVAGVLVGLTVGGVL